MIISTIVLTLIIGIGGLFGTPNIYASIGSDEFCEDNPGHFACDNENDNDSDDDDISNDNENPDNDNFDEPTGCYAAGFEDGQTGPFDSEVYHDNCEGEGKYLDGFIDGCMSIDANTKEVCEGATDA